MAALTFRPLLLLAISALILVACQSSRTPASDGRVAQDLQNLPANQAPSVEDEEDEAILVQYLEIVTPEVDATCAALEELHGVRFGEPEAAFGSARTATMKGGGRIGVRAPLRADEKPVIRPYVLVDDIEAAVKAAEAAGGQFAMYATEIPGHGRFAIYFQGGIQYGLWEH